jgi:general secretion pathway protein I
MTRRRPNGFTLIEMVIAFAILGLTLSVLYGVFAGAMSRIRHDIHLNEGTLIAQSLLARAGSEFSPAHGTVRGRWNDYSYELVQQAIEPAAAQTPPTQPATRVTASVTWRESGGQRDITLSTLKLVPRVVP